MTKRGIVWETKDERNEERKRILEELDREEKSEEKVQGEMGKKLSAYLTELMKNFEDLENLSEENFYSLKQFLMADYLSVSELTEMLKLTDYKASPKNVTEKIGRLVNLGLIKKTKNQNRKIDGRKKPYKLTSVGFFWAVSKLNVFDFGDPFELDKLDIKVFTTYENDYLLQTFILNFINKELLNTERIGNSNLIKLLTFLKPICNRFLDELREFKEFQTTGMIQKPGFNWPNHIKDDPKKWKEFCRTLMETFLRGPYPNSTEEIQDPHISVNSLSFTLKGTLYSIKIVHNGKSKKYKAVLSKNGNPYDEVTAKRNRHYIQLYKVKYAQDFQGDYISHLGGLATGLINSLRFEFGMYLLKCFDKNHISKYSFDEDNTLDKSYLQMITLAKEEQVNITIRKICQELNEHYQEFKEATT